MPKRKKHSDSVKFAAVGIGVLLLVVVLMMIGIIPSLLPKLGLVVPGWEIYNQVGAIANADVVYSQASQFTSPKELMGVYWKVDIDDPNYGVPTIYVALSDITHVDFTGKPIPNDQPAGTVTKTIGNSTYYLDYHIYMYTVTIRTIADKLYYAKSTPLGTIPAWYHETSWPNEWAVWPTGGGDGSHIGIEFRGGAYVKFVISPWTGTTSRSPPNSSYVLDNCWAGVMNTYVFTRELGKVANQWGATPTPDTEAPLYIGGGIDPGNQVPMFEDDGTFGTPAPTINWDPTINPDPRIKSTVVQYLPIQMFPGCYLSKDALGGVLDISPCDVAVTYTLRVDVLQQNKFTLKTAISPPAASWPSDYFSWAQSFWTSLLAGLDPFKIFGSLEPFIWFLFTIGVVLLIVFVLLAVFAPWVLPRIFGGIKSARDALKSKPQKSKGRKGS
jgi:hypothetical protein